MSATSASRVDPAARGRAAILVWDAPVRVFHWLMVLSFAGAWLTAESELWRLLHVTLGYTMGGLVFFRILWGLLGTRYARFAEFVRGPPAIWRYGASMLRRRPDHYTGHNPVGAVAIVALLALTLGVTASGWAIFNDVGGQWLGDAHEALANVMIAVAAVHVAGVLLGSWLHHENLTGAMVSGRKTGRSEEGIRSAWRSVAAAVLVAVLGFWWLQWNSAPTAGGLAERPTAAAKVGDH